MNGIVLLIIVLVVLAAVSAGAWHHHKVAQRHANKVSRSLEQARSNLIDMQASSEYYAAMAEYYRKQIAWLVKQQRALPVNGSAE